MRVAELLHRLSGAPKSNSNTGPSRAAGPVTTNHETAPGALVWVPIRYWQYLYYAETPAFGYNTVLYAS